MALADTSQDRADAGRDRTTDADTVGTVSVPAETAALSPTQLEMMRAFFCYEFEVARLDSETVPVVTREAIREWIEALEMSGLFAPTELRTMSAAWLSEPEALVALLVGDVDEVAARRDVVESAPETAINPSLLRAS